MVVFRHIGKGIFRGKATGANPTDRGKLGTKRHSLVDRRDIPLSTVVTGANNHDMKSAFPTIDSIVADRPKRIKQNICMDKDMIFQR